MNVDMSYLEPSKLKGRVAAPSAREGSEAHIANPAAPAPRDAHFFRFHFLFSCAIRRGILLKPLMRRVTRAACIAGARIIPRLIILTKDVWWECAGLLLSRRMRHQHS